MSSTLQRESILIIFLPQFSSWLLIQTRINLENFFMLRQPKERSKYREYSARFNHDLQLKTDCIKRVLQKIEVNKIPNDRLDGVFRTMIKNLEKREDKATKRPDTDGLWTKIETLQWVLYIIFAIKNERMVVI